MKKALAILVAVMMTLVCSGALAETVKFLENSSAFDIEMALPEGAVVGDQASTELVSYSEIMSEGLASVAVTIAASDIYGDLSMNDLSDEEVEQLKALAAEQFESAEMTVEITPSGNEYIFVSADEEGIDAIFTLYLGYFVELTQWHYDFSEITDADSAFMLQLLYNIEFLPV
ncbi:MAG: hypothetical protein ABIG45_10740 [Bacillota bacterium]